MRRFVEAVARTDEGTEELLRELLGEMSLSKRRIFALLAKTPRGNRKSLESPSGISAAMTVAFPRGATSDQKSAIANAAWGVLDSAMARDRWLLSEARGRLADAEKSLKSRIGALASEKRKAAEIAKAPMAKAEEISRQKNCEPYKGINMGTIKVRYAIEKEIEVPKNLNEEMIKKIIQKKCTEENGIDILWDTEDGLKEYGLTGLFDVIKK